MSERWHITFISDMTLIHLHLRYVRCLQFVTYAKIRCLSILQMGMWHDRAMTGITETSTMQLLA